MSETDTPRTFAEAKSIRTSGVDWHYSATLMQQHAQKLERESDALRRELDCWKGHLTVWGGTPEIIDDFIKGQQEENCARQYELAAAQKDLESLRNAVFALCGHLPGVSQEEQLAAAQKEIERWKARITVLRSGLILIAGSGCEGEDPEQLCKEFELQMTSFCIPCKADYFLELDDKPSAIAQAKGVE